VLTRLLDAAPFLAVAAFFLYESASILFLKSPTISRILAYNLDTHGKVPDFVWGVGVGAFLILLILHITGFLTFWRP
jgi:hypothetical protein